MAKSCKDLFEASLGKAKIKSIKGQEGRTALDKEYKVYRTVVNFSEQELRKSGWSASMAAKVGSIPGSIIAGWKGRTGEYLPATRQLVFSAQKGADNYSKATRALSKLASHLKIKTKYDAGHTAGSSLGIRGRLDLGDELLGSGYMTDDKASSIASNVVNNRFKGKAGASNKKRLDTRIRADHRAKGPTAGKLVVNNDIRVEYVKNMLLTNKGMDASLELTLEPASKNKRFAHVEKIIGTELINEIQKDYIRSLEEEFKKRILEGGPGCKSSPSLEDDIAKLIVDAIVLDKVVKKSKSKTKPKKIKVPALKVSLSTKVLKPKQPQEKDRGQVEAQMSPLALRALLQRAISQTIEQNMGKGRARRVLNYRTGRFAESVNIDNVIPRRDGAMLAFYSYMKNPYSTFAEGGAQYHKGPTRDPNLLIKKSMRQIAAAAAVLRFFPMES